MKHDEYHRQFADAIIEQIRQGTAPWQKPWGPGERVLPANVDTGRSYRGGNSLHLAAVAQERGYGDVRWGTYRQIQARGGQVRKGEQGTRILSFQDHRKIAVNDERGRPKRDNEGKRVYRHERLPTPYVRQYTVFNAEQADGLPAPPTPTPEPLWKVHQQAERVLEDSGVPVRHMAGDRAFYNLNRDEIVLPERGQFPSANHYYQTALHELGHSTGHPERMNRETLVQGIEGGFGSPDYAKEELRAEISAYAAGSLSAARAALTGTGATPQSEGLVRVRRQVCLRTPCPRPLGVAPGQLSLRGKAVQRRFEAADHQFAGPLSVGLSDIAAPATVVQPQSSHRHTAPLARTSQRCFRAHAPRCRCARAVRHGPPVIGGQDRPPEPLSTRLQNNLPIIAPDS